MHKNLIFILLNIILREKNIIIESRKHVYLPVFRTTIYLIQEHLA